MSAGPCTKLQNLDVFAVSKGSKLPNPKPQSSSWRRISPNKTNMSGKSLPYGLSLGKKKSSTSKLAHAKRKPAFGAFGGDGSDDEPTTTSKQSCTATQETAIVEIGGLEDDFSTPVRPPSPEKKPKSRKDVLPPAKPPTRKPKASNGPASALGDLASALTSRKNAAVAEALDANVYEYDAVYDSMKPKKEENNSDDDETVRGPKYMAALVAAAELRKRDMQIAEERRIAREREAEGEEYEGKEKFVTGAYKKLQEENKRLQEEERKKEQQEAKEGMGKGMATFYKDMLERKEKEHAEAVRAAEKAAKMGVAPKSGAEETDASKDKRRTEAEIAREINEAGGSVAVNEDGEVVDKRQLLKGGLNVVKKKEPKKEVKESGRDAPGSGRGPGRAFFGAGGKRAMVERQSKMMEEQLAASLKRARDAEEEEKRKTIEIMTKSKKTEGDISSARERYLARKRAAEEAKAEEG
jgi:coiled-coil domain-containing protein 55